MFLRQRVQHVSHTENIASRIGPSSIYFCPLSLFSMTYASKQKRYAHIFSLSCLPRRRPTIIVDTTKTNKYGQHYTHNNDVMMFALSPPRYGVLRELNLLPRPPFSLAIDIFFALLLFLIIALLARALFLRWGLTMC